jgi:2',3'-cyclic-nucleotide 2'-phosphodiesterase (5'-nucleotidase family)
MTQSRFSVSPSGLLTIVALFAFATQPLCALKKLRLTLFASSTCEECAEIKAQLIEPLVRQHAGNLVVVVRDIDVDNDLALLTVMEKGYHVKNTASQELFFPDTVLIGYDAIMKSGKQLVETYLANPGKWGYVHAYGDSTIDTTNSASTIKDSTKAR